MAIGIKDRSPEPGQLPAGSIKASTPSRKHAKSTSVDYTEKEGNEEEEDDEDDDDDDNSDGEIIPEISEIGGFPRLSSIRLPDFLPRRLLAAAEGYTRPRSGLSNLLGGSSVLPSSDTSLPTSSTTAEPAGVSEPAAKLSWPSWTTLLSPSSPSATSSLHVPAESPLSTPSSAAADPVTAHSPSRWIPQPPNFSTFSAPSFSFSRHLANYLFANADDSAGDLTSEEGYDTEDADVRSDDGAGVGARSSSPSARGLSMSEREERRQRRARERRRRTQQLQQRQLDHQASSDTVQSATAAAAADVGVSVELSEEKERELRNKILAIQALDIPETERALRMHAVMTEEYYRLRNSRGQVPDAYSSVLDENDDGLDEEYYGDEEVELTEADKKSTWFDEQNGIRGCRHYQRGVKLQCSQCEQWHSCRFCHDEVEDSHQLVRYETRNMLCMRCLLPQPAAQDCRGCGTRVARYYCDICKLWDDDPEKSIYHCADCGICRIGEGLGKDFFHCKTCNVCMSIQLENAHRCIEHSTECNCPICGEYMFTSTMTVVFMSCGHSIHQQCYYQHTKNSYKCPTCARSIINMESQFRLLDREIERQALPEPYNLWRSVVYCNDCSAKSEVPFHFLGLKCDTCRSYNTAQIKLIKPEDEKTDAAGGDGQTREQDARARQTATASEIPSAEEFDGLLDQLNEGEDSGSIFYVPEGAARHFERLSLRMRSSPQN